MPELNIRLEIPVTHRGMRVLCAALLLGGLAGDLASESVTLTTYYPAPSGAYSQLITTNNVVLARDLQSPSNQPSFVIVGSTTAATAGQAAANGTKLAVLGGAVGVGSTAFVPSPVVGLQINGTGGTNVDLTVNGRLQISDPNNQGGICVSSGTNSCAMQLGQVPSGSNIPGNTTTIGFFNGPSGVSTSWRMTMNNAGFVGIGADPAQPTYPINPKSTLDVNGQVSISGCAVGTTPYNAGTVSCAGNSYATYLPGLYTYYQAGGDASLSFAGQMYCCPCPNGVCPL